MGGGKGGIILGGCQEKKKCSNLYWAQIYIVLPSVFNDLDLALLQEGGLCQVTLKRYFQSFDYLLIRSFT